MIFPPLRAAFLKIVCLQVACDTFCLDDDASMLEATKALRAENISPAAIRFTEETKEEQLVPGSYTHEKRIRLLRINNF